MYHQNQQVMKNVTWIITRLALLILTSCQEQALEPSLVATFSIASAATGATYEIKVAQPADYFSSDEKYAVIYVLDGDENINLVTSECQKLSAQHGTANVLVVSIGYGRDREMDYTPTKTSSTTGGAPEFIQFIREELIPRMEQEFRADTTRSSRVILGHSYGGLFGAYAFAADNDLFGNYLLLSPSLWFDDEVTMRMEVAQRGALQNKQQLVFMGQGEMESLGKMQAPFEAFFRTLRDQYLNTRVAKNLEEDLGHMGSKNPNIRKGLEFYFSNR